MTAMRLLALCAALLLSGCVTRQYEWDNYDSRLFSYYKDPTTANDFRVSLQLHLESLEAKNSKPPPGLYAELGTLYLERGDDKNAIAYYRKERDSWQESKYLMESLISTIEKRAKSPEVSR